MSVHESHASKAKELLSVVDYAGATRRGSRHGTVNQDSFIHERCRSSQGEVVHVFAVFDGHGILGEVAALIASETLKKLAAHKSAFDGMLADSFIAKPEATMRILFANLQQEVLAAHDKPPSKYTYKDGSYTWKLHIDDPAHPHEYIDAEEARVPIDFGCTAAIAAVTPSLVVVGNTGDASIILVRTRYKDGRPLGSGGSEANFLTVFHRGDSYAEQERINRAHPGAVVFADGYMCPVGHPVIGTYQLNLTRSLGHKYFREVGVIAEPFVTVEHVHAEVDTCVLLACSDGVTDEMPLAAIADRAQTARTAKHLVEDLTDMAHHAGKVIGDVDDCTAVALVIKRC